ncbi:MAG TPA: hypothetical protein ENJ40_03700 [Thermosulfurimonas dismutans]|uniref:Doubled CXXCH motif domain-containing protein n=1 Tax=Thermosulfurimonas dismutans TaxID=999894 RepID=A0A7C3CJV9_9BACT|nr:hypothetical protein [Thermosulfurimonas dismutans]
MRKYFWLGFLVLALLLWMGQAQARVSGVCSNCHTMHNSQGGNPMTYDNGGPYRMLLRGDCVGCHAQAFSNSNATGAIINSIPQVYVIDQGVGSGATLYKFDDFSSRGILAGGNFWYVTQGDQYGHNVAGLVNKDATLQTPPGFEPNYGGVARSSWPAGTQVTCAGTYGCHGDPSKSDEFVALSGAHHADDSTLDGSTPGKSYRFLLGIAGVEDPNWELHPSSSAHNGYYATSITTRGSGNSTGTTPDTASINFLCAECHGKFHDYVLENSGAYGTSNPWVRHPVDFALSQAVTSSDNYTQYPNPNLFTSVSAVGQYFPDVPLGNTAYGFPVNNNGTVSSTVNFTGNDDIVLCLSCHKAHASPWPDMLRWDYSACTAGNQNGNCGCFACHTNK